MARTRVKICGVTRPEDAAAACRHGVDAIGIVLHPASARNVSPPLARAIVAAITPLVTPVGVFVSTTASRMRSPSSAVTSVRVSTSMFFAA